MSVVIVIFGTCGLRFVFEVKLFIDRLCSDWDSQACNLRRAWSWKEAHIIHQSGGMFLHFCDMLEKQMPNNQDFLATMKQHFLLEGMDPDLLAVAERAVPPGDLKAIGLCRLVLGSIQVSTG